MILLVLILGIGGPALAHNGESRRFNCNDRNRTPVMRRQPTGTCRGPRPAAQAQAQAPAQAQAQARAQAQAAAQAPVAPPSTYGAGVVGGAPAPGAGVAIVGGGIDPVFTKEVTLRFDGDGNQTDSSGTAAQIRVQIDALARAGGSDSGIGAIFHAQAAGAGYVTPSPRFP